MSDGAKYFLFASFIHIFPVHRKFCISALFFCHNMWHLRMQCIHKVLVNFNVEYFWSVNIKYCVYHHSFVNIKLVFLWIFTLCLSFECHLELFMLWLRLEPTFQRFDLSNAESFCFILKKKNTKNWYTIDALGAIFAIFPILDTFTILLQYWYLKISQNVVDIIDILANPVQLK